MVLRRRFSEISIRFPSHVEIDTIWGTPNGKRLQKAIEHGHLNSEFPYEKWWIFP
jgi:hypothetical protein